MIDHIPFKKINPKKILKLNFKNNNTITFIEKNSRQKLDGFIKLLIEVDYLHRTK